MSETVTWADAMPPMKGEGGSQEKIKAQLIRKVAVLNRGFVAMPEERADIEELVELLEEENPNPAPCHAFADEESPVAGYWRLVYTTALDVLSLTLNPAVTVGQIYQRIAPDGRQIENIIELQPPLAAVANRLVGSSVARLTVKLDTEPVSDNRINLRFRRTELAPQTVFGKDVSGTLPPLGFDIPSLGQGKDAEKNAWFETTYVDEDVRVGRSARGDLFVSLRAEEPAPQ